MKHAVLIAVALATMSAPKAIADADDCRDAVSTYNSKLNDVDYALRRYGRCVSDSRGQDDCSSEFRRLRYAQDDFETAVNAIRSECD
jgi:hypothetical protein